MTLVIEELLAIATNQKMKVKAYDPVSYVSTRFYQESIFGGETQIEVAIYAQTK